VRLLPVRNDGDAPAVVRLRGLERALAPAEVVYALAAGRRVAALEVERVEGALVVRGADEAGDFALVGHEPGQDTLLGEAASFRTHLQAAFASWKPLQVSTFAALVAERHRAPLRDFGDTRPGPMRASVPEILERLWLAEKRLDGSVADRLEADVKALRDHVDPDRFASPGELRAFRVLGHAVRCSARRAPPLDLATAALEARAGLPAMATFEPGRTLEQGATWAWKPVQDEARWLSATVNALSAASGITPETMRALGAALRPPREPARAARPPTAARPVRPPVAAKPAAPPAAPRPPAPAAPSPPPGPRTIALTVAGRRLELERVEGATYLAKIDGARRVLRTRAGGAEAWTEGATARLESLAECARAKVEPAATATRTTFEHHVQWGHFRQTRTTRVSIELAADGAVEIETFVAEQDESYY
jgi:hypothetical protein